MKDAVVQTEVYRLKGPRLEVTYRRGEAEVTLEIADPDLSHLSGRRGVAVVTEPDIGMRLDGELLFSRGGVRVMLTLLLPEIDRGNMDGDAVELNGAAIITHVFRGSVKQVPAQQSYDITELKGTMTLEG